MKKNLVLAGFLVALLAGIFLPSAGGAARAASHSPSHPALFDKTRVALHLGLAYFAFHHFVYARWKNGSFKAGASHRTTNILKAGVALLFTYHELKKAYDIAKGSSSHLLQVLVKPMSGLINKSKSVADRLRGGQYSDAEVQDITNAANSFSQTATKNGVSIKDVPVFPTGA